MADPMSLAWQQAVDGFAEHLADERNRSAHTVRAYLADVNDLVGFCVDRDIESPAQLALPTLRAWLADATQDIHATTHECCASLICNLQTCVLSVVWTPYECV